MPPVTERLLGKVLCSVKHGDRAIRARHFVDISGEADSCDNLFICFGATDAGEHQVVIPMEILRDGGIPLEGPQRKLTDLRTSSLAEPISGSDELYHGAFAHVFGYWGITPDRFRELAVAHAPTA